MSLPVRFRSFPGAGLRPTRHPGKEKALLLKEEPEGTPNTQMEAQVGSFHRLPGGHPEFPSRSRPGASEWPLFAISQASASSCVDGGSVIIVSAPLDPGHGGAHKARRCRREMPREHPWTLAVVAAATVQVACQPRVRLELSSPARGLMRELPFTG